ncbi:MAG: hypothetical protein IT342_24120 [Candidatus Melainabacteria bacterium]|nr:hypothetical protein [Candidatus Melainabacteria bacterium]
MREISIDNVTIERHPSHPVRDAFVGGLAASAWETMRENAMNAARSIRNDASFSGELSMDTPTSGTECKDGGTCMTGSRLSEGMEKGSHPLLKAGILRHVIRDIGEEHGLSPCELKQAFGRHLIRQNYRINRR